MGRKVIIMRNLDSIDSKGGNMVKTAKVKARCSLKCTLTIRISFPSGERQAQQGRSRLGESGSTV